MKKARIGDRSRWLRAGILCLLVGGEISLQGCLAVAWVAVVGYDSLRTSDLTFWPFEQSWVAPKEQDTVSDPHFKVTSVAVLPFDGDPEMGTRLAGVLQQETSLRVEGPDRSPRSEEHTSELQSPTNLVCR